jgi:hypothetical protein
MAKGIESKGEKTLGENKKRSECSDLLAELNELMKKYNLNSFFFFGQKNENSSEYYLNYEISNYEMIKIFSKILFHDSKFEMTRDVIISDALRFCDPHRVTGQLNDGGEYEEVPFIPSVFLED